MAHVGEHASRVGNMFDDFTRDNSFKRCTGNGSNGTGVPENDVVSTTHPLACFQSIGRQIQPSQAGCNRTNAVVKPTPFLTPVIDGLPTRPRFNKWTCATSIR